MSAYDVEIRVTPREGILDPEGETIGRALENLGYEGAGRVRAGRLISLRLEASDEVAARDTASRMCEELIANPVIEDYEIRVEGESPEASSAPAKAREGGAA